MDAKHSRLYWLVKYISRLNNWIHAKARRWKPRKNRKEDDDYEMETSICARCYQTLHSCDCDIPNLVPEEEWNKRQYSASKTSRKKPE